MISRCTECGGATKQEKVRVEHWWGETRTLVDDVPADVCQQCGEQYFARDTILLLEELCEKPEQRVAVEQVSVFAYPA